MISVSNGWKTAQTQTLLPEMFVEITYKATEPGLQELAVASGNNPEPFSDFSNMMSLEDKYSEAYATLDYGCWGLDGSFSIFDGSPENPGYVDTNYSTDNGELAVSPYPTIIIDFSERRNLAIPGLNITWNKTFMGWATDFRVTASNSNGQVAQTTVRNNNSVVSSVFLDIVNYTRIEIEVLKWSHPYQRVRCMQIEFGIQKIYTKSDLLGYEHSQSVDLLSAALPNNSITFKLRNDDNRWNPDNPTGFEKYLIERQELTVRYGMDVGDEVEWIKGGTFWLSEWSTPANGLEAVFTARDAMEFMYGIYTGVRSGTLYDIAVAAFEEAGLSTMIDGSKRYIVSDVLKSYSTDFTADETEYTIAEMLQMVAHAGCCVFYQDRDGLIHIEPWKKQYSDYQIDANISYSHPEYTITKPLKAVAVSYGADQRLNLNVGSKGEVQTVDNPLIVTTSDAMRVGNTTRDILVNRKVISGDFRADLRMDVLDGVIISSKYASNIIGVTDVKYTSSGGAFKGTYTGRVVSVAIESSHIFSGDIYAGEI